MFCIWISAASRAAFCFKEDVAKLFFCKTVVSFQLLLFLHHDAIGGKFFLLGVLSLLTCSIGSLCARALCRTPDAISEPTAHFVFSLNLFHPDSFLLEKVLFLCPEVSSKDRDPSDNLSAGLQKYLINISPLKHFTSPIFSFFQQKDIFFEKFLPPCHTRSPSYFASKRFSA